MPPADHANGGQPEPRALRRRSSPEAAASRQCQGVPGATRVSGGSSSPTAQPGRPAGRSARRSLTRPRCSPRKRRRRGPSESRPRSSGRLAGSTRSRRRFCRRERSRCRQPRSRPSDSHAGRWGRFHAGFLLFRFSATASRMRSFSAASLILSFSLMSMARLTFPSRLELKRPEGSSKAAPLKKVSLTTFL